MNDEPTLKNQLDALDTKEAERRAKLSTSMKAFYANNPDRKPGRLPDGTKPKRKRRAKKRNPNVTEVPLDAVPDIPEKKKRKYTKKSKIVVKAEKKPKVDDALKLAIVTLLNKLL